MVSIAEGARRVFMRCDKGFRGCYRVLWCLLWGLSNWNRSCTVRFIGLLWVSSSFGFRSSALDVWVAGSQGMGLRFLAGLKGMVWGFRVPASRDLGFGLGLRVQWFRVLWSVALPCRAS